MQQLADTMAIVTGAGTGIGREAAKMLAEEGASVVLVGRRVAPLESVCAEIEQAGGTAAVHAADLTDGNAAAGVAAFAQKHFGRVDLLINNAGFSSKVRSIRYVQPDEWDAVFKVNIDGVFRLTQACLPGMIERRRGTIITVSSVAAFKPGIVGGAPYSAAKAASRNLSHGLNAELREFGVRATAILPGEVDTPILLGRPQPPDAEARSLMMQPEDVARCILLAATLPPRTVVEELIVSPTIPRDMSAEIAVAKTAGS